MEKYWDILFMFAKAFAVGGLICTVAQVVINFTKLTSGKILVFFMLAGVTLEALGLYGYLVDFAGAGATVPISGFGYLLARGRHARGTARAVRRADGGADRRQARALRRRFCLLFCLRWCSDRNRKRIRIRSA